jgi:hypothetical protein
VKTPGELAFWDDKVVVQRQIRPPHLGTQCRNKLTVRVGIYQGPDKTLKRFSTMVMTERIQAWLLLATFVLVHSASAQIIGVDLCACQPSVITFKLNFTITCDDSTVVPGSGINDTACLVDTRGNNENITDEVPTYVSLVQIQELGEGPIYAVLGLTEYTDGYYNGDEITYTSIVETKPDSINASTIPRGFQVAITGLNANEETLVQTWAITYTNDCGIFPLLTVGEQIGWSVFVSIVVRDTLTVTICPTNVAHYSLLVTDLSWHSRTRVLSHRSSPNNVPFHRGGF